MIGWIGEHWETVIRLLPLALIILLLAWAERENRKDDMRIDRSPEEWDRIQKQEAANRRNG